MLTGLWATGLILGPLTTSGLGLVSVSGVTFSRGFQKIGSWCSLITRDHLVVKKKKKSLSSLLLPALEMHPISSIYLKKYMLQCFPCLLPSPPVSLLLMTGIVAHCT